MHTHLLPPPHTLDLDEGLSSLIASVTLFLFVNLYRSPFSLVGELCSSNNSINIQYSFISYVDHHQLYDHVFYGMRVKLLLNISCY